MHMQCGASLKNLVDVNYCTTTKMLKNEIKSIDEILYSPILWSKAYNGMDFLCWEELVEKLRTRDMRDPKIY